MYVRSDPSGQWSVYAEFTISHPGVGDPQNNPHTRTEQGDNSVRMTYSWNSQGNPPTTGNASSETVSNPSAYAENRHAFETGEGYGFQKGNLLFTSTPPNRRPSNLPTSTGSRLNAQESSGYGSYMLSPNSMSSGTSMHNQEGRKCRSTCNITLCANQYAAESCHHHCGRTQSLRCQTPSSKSDYKNAYYGCGDPWCHHLKMGDDFSMGGRCSPVLEGCEDNSSVNGKSNKATRSLSRELDNRKDVSVQTFEMVDKCTSPISRDDAFGFDGKPMKKNRKIKRRSLSLYQRKIGSLQESNSPSSFTPDSLESGRHKPIHRFVRSPNHKKIPHIETDKSELSTTTGTTTDDKSSGSRKPRTVHIDVYCTGTEVESDSTNTNHSDNDTASTPQTVFESEQVKITHKRADLNDVPICIKENETKSNETRPSFRLHKQLSQDKSESEDDASMAYPSKLSSYSTIKDFASSVSSVPVSWANSSMSSCAIPDPDYDSVANTSWKDNTYSDIGSILQSRSSIAGTESSLFVPRRILNKNMIIDEKPELLEKDRDKSSSGVSLQQSDSFEYANSEDKMRIKKMESVWQKEKIKEELLKKMEKKRQDKMNEYVQKKLRRIVKKETKETDSDDSEGEGWTFVENIGDTNTVRRLDKEDRNGKEIIQKLREVEISEDRKEQMKGIQKNKPVLVDQGSLSDSSPSPSCRTPSSAALLQRLSLDPSLRAPFTLAPGLYTEQRSIAKKFGPVISAFKKPGHHIGPVRNPECACDHCKSYYENVGFRSRTRSLGDPPLQNWKDPFST